MTRLPASIVATSMLVLALGACGSSSSSKSLSLPGANSNNSPGGSSSGGNSLSDLVGKSKTANIKVTYKTGDNGDTVTIIQRGNDSVYKSGDTAIYNIGGKTTTCNGTGSSAQCTSIGGVGSSLGAGNILGVYSKLVDSLAGSPLAKNLKTSGQTVAGRSAKCLTLTGALAAAAGGKSGTICVDADTGILLKVSSDESGSAKDVFEATSVGTPSNADFTLPATPQTIPSFTVPSTP